MASMIHFARAAVFDEDWWRLCVSITGGVCATGTLFVQWKANHNESKRRLYNKSAVFLSFFVLLAQLLLASSSKSGEDN